ncbi:IS701 family transposase [Amycolatopsis alkalitolerans]|uniref:IS701 family transposase n=1 Tax=Amycolatopsis alkalitolerans TaxID=2547244 RepID=A0A5C4M6V0_9PSEU|nr:IS701 family transposase [Amycolatopsis alkalitolerans]TNC28631.1 IS701 family transposase [Amycolatopsis alkalitolerans]
MPRKNCWTLAEYAGDAAPHRMQRLLERASWNTFAVMHAVRDFVAEHLADPHGLAVLVLDESGQEKSGTTTAGVKRQYVGCAGKVANAVNFVNATYSTPRGHALVGSRLYIPAEQLADETTRTTMGIDPAHEFKSKPQLGCELLTDTVDAGVQVDWCTADAVYGRDRALREECEKRRIGYSLGVPCSFRIRLPSKAVVRADATLKLIPTPAWQTASCGPGSTGDRRYSFAWLSTASPRHFLLIRRSLTKPSELAYFYCYAPDPVPATLTTLVAVTGQRWTIEEDHEFDKDQFGFDQSQVRLYTPLMRHITLVMAALAVCAITTAQTRTYARSLPTPSSPTERPPADLGLIPLTVVEVKRLFNLATRVCRSTEHYLYWSWWRRQHQARARWYHHRARLT